MAAVGTRWVAIAETVGRRVVDGDWVGDWRTYIPKFNHPVKRRRPATPTINLQQVTARFAFDDAHYTRWITICIGFNVLALVGIAALLVMLIGLETVVYALIEFFGFLGGILVLVIAIACAIGLVTVYLATTTRVESDDLEF